MKAKDQSVTGLTKGIEFLFKKNGVEYIKGAGSFVNEHEVKVALNDGGETSVRGKNILIATGSEASGFPGLEIDEKRVITSTGALSLEKVPESMVVIGGGIIGLEMGSVWSRLGSKVTVVEFLGQIGGPGMDTETSKTAQKLLKKQGMNFMLNTKVTAGDTSGDKIKLEIDASKGGKPDSVSFRYQSFYKLRHNRRFFSFSFYLSQVLIQTSLRRTLSLWPLAASPTLRALASKTSVLS